MALSGTEPGDIDPIRDDFHSRCRIHLLCDVTQPFAVCDERIGIPPDRADGFERARNATHLPGLPPVDILASEGHEVGDVPDFLEATGDEARGHTEKSMDQVGSVEQADLEGC